MQLPLRVLVAPSGFKESLGPDEVADCIEEGIYRAMQDIPVIVRKVPVHDGGEGFCRALVAAYGGELRPIEVMGPVKQLVQSHYGLIGHDRKTAVLDMAAAAGLSLVPTHSRDPTRTTTYGVGQLISAALDNGCTRIIIGCGDSGTSDGGAGMLQALGAKLFDAHDVLLPVAEGGGSLVDLKRICVHGLHPRLKSSSPGSYYPSTTIVQH
jgi:glycerate kinase